MLLPISETLKDNRAYKSKSEVRITSTSKAKKNVRTEVCNLKKARAVIQSVAKTGHNQNVIRSNPFTGIPDGNGDNAIQVGLMHSSEFFVNASNDMKKCASKLKKLCDVIDCVLLTSGSSSWFSTDGLQRGTEGGAGGGDGSRQW